MAKSFSPKQLSSQNANYLNWKLFWQKCIRFSPIFCMRQEVVLGLVCPVQKPVTVWRSTRHRHTSVHRVKTSLEIQILGAEALMVNPESLITTPCPDVLFVEWSMRAWLWELLLVKAWDGLPTAPQTGTVAPPLWGSGSNSDWDLNVRGISHFVRGKSWCIWHSYIFILATG